MLLKLWVQEEFECTLFIPNTMPYYWDILNRMTFNFLHFFTPQHCHFNRATQIFFYTRNPPSRTKAVHDSQRGYSLTFRKDSRCVNPSENILNMGGKYVQDRVFAVVTAACVRCPFHHLCFGVLLRCFGHTALPSFCLLELIRTCGSTMTENCCRFFRKLG